MLVIFERYDVMLSLLESEVQLDFPGTKGFKAIPPLFFDLKDAKQATGR